MPKLTKREITHNGKTYSLPKGMYYINDKFHVIIRLDGVKKFCGSFNEFTKANQTLTRELKLKNKNNVKAVTEEARIPQWECVKCHALYYDDAMPKVCTKDNCGSRAFVYV